MHAQQETMRILLEGGADYVTTAIKRNQPTIFEDLEAIDLQGAVWHETVDKAHDRIEVRRCAAVDLTAREWDGYADLHGRRPARPASNAVQNALGASLTARRIQSRIGKFFKFMQDHGATLRIVTTKTDQSFDQEAIKHAVGRTIA